MWISEAGTIHRWFSGHILWSLLPISGWVNRSLISWLSFCAVRFLCFFAYVFMTSVRYGMSKSLCKVMFDMYQGALANFLNVLDGRGNVVGMLSAYQRLSRVKHLLWIIGTTCPKRTHASCDGWSRQSFIFPRTSAWISPKNLALKIYVPEIKKQAASLEMWARFVISRSSS
jgi:hypothetical protein